MSKSLLFALITAISFGVYGCDSDGPAERVGENLDNAADSVKDKVDDAGDSLSEVAKDACDKVGDATDSDVEC